jgi:F-type H+-transporting ATPase subunit c
MRKIMMYLFMALALMCVTMPVYAQGGGNASPASWAVPIGSGIGMAIASGLCGIGQGKATASAAEAVARNPGARAGIQFVLIFGLVLIESLALYVFAIIFLKVK